MFSRFFIDRPIFATVLSLVTTLAGCISVLALPVTQYPEITPPTVEVSAYYPGANAQVVADTVIRKLPGALGHVESAVEESFSEALEGGPEYPHYTRPASYRGWDVPEVLLSGDHARVRQWRLERSRAAKPGP